MGTKNVQRTSMTKIARVHGMGQAATSTINMTGTWCNRNRHQYLDAMLKEVQYNSMQNFNLFSITKAMLQGCFLMGDSKKGSVALEK